ncbi:dihydroneopterin aldolase [Lentibacter sp.]|uniref:dihydroneopterin aldolase n=1 Tax=Lentibacter sp. TaxID=2024994 RepID=UPI003F6A2090
MKSETSQAFDHPDARSRATSMATPLDRISLRDHIVDVEIGAFQAERGTTQRISFNVVVEVLPTQLNVEDDVDKILSYDKVTEAISIALGEERLNLLETLADRVAERILWEPQAVRAFVRIEKLDRGPGALGVEIVRAKANDGSVSNKETKISPLVVFFSNEAIASAHLQGWIDQLATNTAPTLICVGAPDTSPPQALSPLAQRRIDLLSIEQNAWILAARDKRCVVVETRTELDWAMKNNQISVWAPSKLVLDTVDGPSTECKDALDLALWFATDMGAERFVAFDQADVMLQTAFPVAFRKSTEPKI